MAQRLPLIVMLNKLDRLVLELKLPPSDAYYKIKHTLDEVNKEVLANRGRNPDQPLVGPSNGNLVFGATQFGCVFSIQSFAEIYCKN